jgi:tetratricopeptide (TPR) repeat protein
MSQVEPTDLLCRSRREELTPDEQRSLNESLSYSLEVKLMNEMLPELERQSRVRSGDDLLLARINARVLSPARISQRAPARRRGLRIALIAAAVLLVAGLAGAWLGAVRQKRALAPPPSSVASPPTPKPSARARFLPAIASPPAVEPPDGPVPPAEPSGSATGRGAGGASRPAFVGSASELFARANLLRREGRAREAAALYELLLERFPSSREVGPTRLALGKYLQRAEPARALAQYRAAAGGGGALRAEALWGISEIATSLGERSASEQALADLLREFPDSPYAEVARARTSHGER